MLFVGIGTPLLALGMLGLFNPPHAVDGNPAPWFLAMLLLVYAAFSMVQISYQAYGAEVSADPVERTRVTAYREGFGLVGVFLAAALPEAFARMQGVRGGYALFAWTFMPLALGMAWLTMRESPLPVPRQAPQAAGPTEKRGVPAAMRAMLEPLRNARFVHLLAIFMCSGIAASIPATLVLFFIDDVIQAPDQSATFLIAYFAAGAAGMPMWVRLSARLGKGRAWLVGMVLSIAAFVWAFTLSAGDVVPFMIICVLSGLGLGADLALPPSLLADVIDEDASRGVARREGAYFGLWNLVTKLNLALAAGLALPLLSWLGYQPHAQSSAVMSARASADVLVYLSGVYALLPCLLKASAGALLLASPFFHRTKGNRT
jgi:Na+/melibiose symporter-like transporter